MIKKFKDIMFILFLALLLSGCWDYKDVDKRSILLSNGVDEINGKIQYTS
jgi:spore germination protein KC